MFKCLQKLQTFFLSRPVTTKNIFTAFVVMFLVGFSTSGFAVDDLGGMGTHLGDQASALAGGIKIIAYLAGFIMVIAGVAMLASQNRQQPKTVPVTLLICGIILVSINFFIGFGTQSFFGQDAEGLKDLGV